MLDRCLAVLASALPLFLLAGCEIEDPLCVETRRIDPIPNAVSLPVELEQNYGSLTMGLPVVRWRGRDGTERRILVDTGCPATLLLSSRTAAAEHFKPQWFASSTLFDDSGTTMALRRADVPELAIGPVRFRASGRVCSNRTRRGWLFGLATASWRDGHHQLCQGGDGVQRGAVATV